MAKISKSKKIKGKVIDTGYGYQGCYPGELPFAVVECEDGIRRRWWMGDENIEQSLKHGQAIEGYIRERTGNLFRVKILNQQKGT